jgi:hypothetical protein
MDTVVPVGDNISDRVYNREQYFLPACKLIRRSFIFGIATFFWKCNSFSGSSG